MKTNHSLKLLDKYFAELVMIIFSLFLIGNHLYKEKINDETKFIRVIAKTSSYEFKDGPRGSHEYYFTCDKYCNVFQIKANYLPFFNKEKFPTKNESDIEFLISAIDFKSIKTCEKIFVYGIKANKQNVLDFSKVVEFENTSYFFLFPYFLLICAAISALIKNRR